VILDAIVESETTSVSVRDSAAIAEATGIDQRDVIMALRALTDHAYVEASKINVNRPHGFDFVSIRALPAARRATRQWPSADPFEELIVRLEVTIAGTSDPARRTLTSFGQGIRVHGESHSIHDNDFRGNSGIDCVDASKGDGTSGTANTWIRNLGRESDPRGICRRSVGAANIGE
jgi:hypothetical protein